MEVDSQQVRLNLNNDSVPVFRKKLSLQVFQNWEEIIF